MEDTFTKRSVSPPVWVRTSDGTNGGPGFRGCTDKYKTRPINKFIRQFANVPRGCTDPVVAVRLGISTDEALRQKDSRLPWMLYRHPLLSETYTQAPEPEQLNLSRADCVDYLAERGFAEVPKSACYFCPFHSDALWAEVKELDPEGFKSAIEFDGAVRDGTRGDPADGRAYFLHRSLLPLADVDLPEFSPGAGHEGVGCAPYSCPGDVIARIETAARRHRLAEVRRSRGVTQQQAAEALKINQSRVSRAESQDLARMEIGSLSAYVAALGGRLRLIADFDDDSMVL